MRDSLKNLFTNEVILDDTTSFYYTVQPYELKNPLGNIAAILQEYTFTQKEDNADTLSYKLYKTKEGYWYDLEENQSGPDQNVTRMLKAAINQKENNNLVEEPGS
jgi:hypothetical protein